MNDMKWCLAVSIGILKITLPPAIGVKKVTLERGRHGVALRGGAAAFFRSKSDESSDNLPASLPPSLSLCCGGFVALGKCFHLSPRAAAALLCPLFRSPSSLGPRTDGRHEC